MNELRKLAWALLLAISPIGPLAVALAADPSSTAVPTLGIQTRVQLQAAMQAHIDRTTVHGVYPSLDLESGRVSALHPASGHPMILSLGEYYVLCADFRDAAGAPVNVDFYVAKRDRGFSVFRVEFGNRGPLELLVRNGVAAMLR